MGRSRPPRSPRLRSARNNDRGSGAARSEDRAMGQHGSRQPAVARCAAPAFGRSRSRHAGSSRRAGRGRAYHAFRPAHGRVAARSSGRCHDSFRCEPRLRRPRGTARLAVAGTRAGRARRRFGGAPRTVGWRPEFPCRCEPQTGSGLGQKGGRWAGRLRPPGGNPCRGPPGVYCQAPRCQRGKLASGRWARLRPRPSISARAQRIPRYRRRAGSGQIRAHHRCRTAGRGRYRTLAGHQGYAPQRASLEWRSHRSTPATAAR